MNSIDLTPGAMDRLIRHAWPGNVRELENVIERAVVMSPGKLITEKELAVPLVQDQPHAGASRAAQTTLEDMERTAIYEALGSTGGNKTEAAKRLGITRKTLHLKLQKYEGNGP